MIYTINFPKTNYHRHHEPSCVQECCTRIVGACAIRIIEAVVGAILFGYLASATCTLFVGATLIGTGNFALLTIGLTLAIPSLLIIININGITSRLNQQSRYYYD